jgi:alpha-beta hydrolase superfamily lysophospholipase
MMETTWNFQSEDGISFFAREWKPDSAKAVIALVHGHGEHIGRYEHVAAAMNAAGYAMTGFDLRGHGQSTGKRGHTPSYDAMLDDVMRFLRETETRFPNLPLFLYGHSLGGNLVINTALRRQPPVKGVIATGPWLRLAFEPPAFQVVLAKTVNGIFPGLLQSSGLETAALSHDESVVRAYENDPLVHDKISARLFLVMYEAGLWALDHASALTLPLLLMHGDADRLTSAEASREFAERAGDKVTLKIWEGAFHEIHNEPEKEAVFQTMITWMDALLSV